MLGFAFVVVNLVLSAYFLDAVPSPNPTSRALPVLTIYEEGRYAIDTYEKATMEDRRGAVGQPVEPLVPQLLGVGRSGHAQIPKRWMSTSSIVAVMSNTSRDCGRRRTISR